MYIIGLLLAAIAGGIAYYTGGWIGFIAVVLGQISIVFTTIGSIYGIRKNK